MLLENSLDDVNSIHRVENNYRNCIKLKILSLNVCGLRSKLVIPDFVTHISQYDILCFTESKTNATDCMSTLIPGYTLCLNNRKGTRPSGGIAIGIRNEPTHLIKVNEKITSQYISCLVP